MCLYRHRSRRLPTFREHGRRHVKGFLARALFFCEDDASLRVDNHVQVSVITKLPKILTSPYDPGGLLGTTGLRQHPGHHLNLDLFFQRRKRRCLVNNVLGRITRREIRSVRGLVFKR